MEPIYAVRSHHLYAAGLCRVLLRQFSASDCQYLSIVIGCLFEIGVFGRMMPMRKIVSCVSFWLSITRWQSKALFYREAFAVQKIMASQGLLCWARDILLVLDELNLAHLWHQKVARIPIFLRSLQSANRGKWITWLCNDLKPTRFYSRVIEPQSPTQLTLAKHLN